MGRRSLLLVAALALCACSTSVQSPTPTPSVMPSPVPTASPTASLGFVWTRQDVDPSPGGVVADMIARALAVPSSTIRAAVFGFAHPAGNTPWIWAFRAEGVSSAVAIERWSSFESRCAAEAEPVTLAGLAATEITFKLVDQCEPEYLVALDAQTVAMIIDDGGYRGNGAVATPVPYRPLEEISQLVEWLQRNLPSIPLMTGGPIPANG